MVQIAGFESNKWVRSRDGYSITPHSPQTDQMGWISSGKGVEYRLGRGPIVHAQHTTIPGKGEQQNLYEE